MSSPTCLRALRSLRAQEILSTRKAAYLRFYSVTQCKLQSDEQPGTTNTSIESRGEVSERIEELRSAKLLDYPRIGNKEGVISCEQFRHQFSVLGRQKTDVESVTLNGRVYSVRVAGNKLVFIDIKQNGRKVQILVNLGEISSGGVTPEQFKTFYHIVRRGDIISATGVPARTTRGELSLSATSLPQLLTPCLHPLPTSLDDPMTRMRHRHADLLVNQQVFDTLKLRSHIIRYLRNFLNNKTFLEVSTPLLVGSAGGAVAKPFLTSSIVISDRSLALRIAPELWLKRLVIGGYDRVFEIGPAFRNEGIDATHNPEFTTCEFYQAFAELEELMATTEIMISGLVTFANTLIDEELFSLESIDAQKYSAPFRRLEFIPALEKGLDESLPDLESDQALDHLRDLFTRRGLHEPSSPTVPKLLDKLASIYLEPYCDLPTFIISHPACLAPLAKSYRDEKTGQILSARAELFIGKRELANMYEEENSPFAQRQKLMDQLGKYRDSEVEGDVLGRGDADPQIDESYLEALEWGLPPTGGWGLGIDRLVMQLSGRERIADVLSFGTVKNVIGLGGNFRAHGQ